MLRRWFLAAAGAAVVLFAGVLGGLACRPSWYSPAAIDYARLKADKADLANTLDRIGGALNSGAPITIALNADQVNRWLTARDEIWPDVDPPALDVLRDPQIAFLDGGVIRAAARVAYRGWPAVVSGDVGVRIDGERIHLEIGRPRIGVVPIPLVRWRLQSALARGMEQAGVPVDASGGGLAIDNDWVWPNGKRRFSIQSLEVSNGSLRVTLQPR